MNLDLVTDSDGKDHLMFDSSDLYDDSRCGDRIEDFEILRQLGGGSFGSVSKVRSKLNQKIYAMKQVNTNKLEDDALRLSINEIKYLQNLHNKHVIKYYSHFEVKGILYIIIEYMNNGDLSSLMNSYVKMGTHIKEEILWNIFLQSMAALSYIHRKGIIHRDIKPANLMMDNNSTIKLGDFGVSCLMKENPNEMQSNQKKTFIFKKNDDMLLHGTICGTAPYMAREMINENDNDDTIYDQKIDVYSMGCTFFELCYFHKYKERNPNSGDNFDLIRVEDPKDKNVHYSNELLNIVYSMLDDNSATRPTSKQIYEKLVNEYTNKYVRNTSIESVIRCIYSLPRFRKDFFNLDIFEHNKPICYKYKECLLAIEDKRRNWKECINRFRQYLGQENSKLEGSQEIEPKIMLGFLLEKIHKEINVINNNQNDDNQHLIIPNLDEEKTNKFEMFLRFSSNFLKSFNSIISNNFLGISTIIHTCQNCNLNTFSFKNFGFVTLNLMNYKGNRLIINQAISDQNMLLKAEELFCGRCLEKKNHKTRKTYYNMPNCLVISLSRGPKCQINTPIDPSQTFIDLSNVVENQSSPKQFNLVGIIRRNNDQKERYSSVINMNGRWVGCEEGNEFEVNANDIMNNNSKIMMLFYQAC